MPIGDGLGGVLSCLLRLHGLHPETSDWHVPRDKSLFESITKNVPCGHFRMFGFLFGRKLCFLTWPILGLSCQALTLELWLLFCFQLFTKIYNLNFCIWRQCSTNSTTNLIISQLTCIIILFKFVFFFIKNYFTICPFLENHSLLNQFSMI